jgi:L-alanine-DL-glutamate epimerase-like enolase superfamily enzyme
MAIWDAAAKIAGLPLYRFLAEQTGRTLPADPAAAVYAGGGYYYPAADIARLSDEIRRLRDMGYDRVKIKIAGKPIDEDIARVDAAVALLPDAGHLAVDAIYGYDARTAPVAAGRLAPYGLWWFEDICDPHDFETQAAVAGVYGGAIAAGEALFSAAEARLLDRHGGLRRDRDILLFDPVHCYGLPGYLEILHDLEARGWARSAFWPHGGHLFTLHVVSGLGLGGAEVNPLCFQPFGGLPDGVAPQGGRATPPEAPGIGFETRTALHRTFAALLNA